MKWYENGRNGNSLLSLKNIGIYFARMRKNAYPVATES